MKQFTVPQSSGGCDFDIAVVVSFGYFIPKNVISKFQYGGINMHPSLLPRHRGAAPIYHTILSDDSEAGVSIIELHPTRFDAGNILMQVKHDSFKRDVLYKPLLEQLAGLGADKVVETLERFPELSKTSQPQSEEGKTLAPKIDRELTRVNWENQTRKQIWTLYRAFSDNLGFYGYIYNKKYKAKKRVKILGMIPPIDVDESNHEMYQQVGHVTASINEQVPHGTFFIDTINKENLYKDHMWVKCKDGWVGLTKLLEEGKSNPVSPRQFFMNKPIVLPNNKEGIEIPSTQIFE
eukprot:gene5125-6380_t